MRYQLKTTIADGFNAVGLVWAAMAALTLSTTHIQVEAVPHMRARVTPRPGAPVEWKFADAADRGPAGNPVPPAPPAPPRPPPPPPPPSPQPPAPGRCTWERHASNSLDVHDVHGVPCHAL